MQASLSERRSALSRDHRVETFGGAFHVPGIASYPALFAWDSGYQPWHFSLSTLRPRWRN